MCERYVLRWIKALLLPLLVLTSCQTFALRHDRYYDRFADLLRPPNGGDDSAEFKWRETTAEIASRNVDTFVRILRDHEDRDVRANVAYVLARVSPPPKKAMPALARALGDDSTAVRRRSARALWGFGADAKPAVPTLATMLHHKDEETRKWVALSLGRIGPDAKVAVPELISMLEEGGTDERRFAARALGRIGPEASAAVPVLIEAMDDEDKGPSLSSHNIAITGPVSEEAIIALGRIGPEAKDAIPYVTEKAEGDEWQRVYAVSALGRIGPDTIPELVGLVVRHTCDWPLERYVSEALGCMDAAAIPAMFRTMKDVHAELGSPSRLRRPYDEESPAHSVMYRVQGVIANGLAMMGTAAVQALLDGLEDRDEWIRETSAKALGRVRPVEKRVICRLIEMGDHPDPDMRAMGVEALGEVGAGAVPFLIKALEDTHVSTAAAYLAIDALGRIGPEAWDAIPILEEEITSASAYAQKVKEALHAIRGSEEGSQ